MKGLPDFRLNLERLLNPGPGSSTPLATDKPLPSSQKRIVGLTLAGLLLLVASLIFACIFVIKLWPVAFPGAVSNPTLTSTPFPSLTLTILPTFTPTPVIPTQTPTLFPTLTSTTQPPSLTPLPVGVLTGNLNVRTEPSTGAIAVGIIYAGEKVIIRDRRDNWYLITSANRRRRQIGRLGQREKTSCSSQGIYSLMFIEQENTVSPHLNVVRMPIGEPIEA